VPDPVTYTYTWDEEAPFLPQLSNQKAKDDIGSYLSYVRPAISADIKTCIMAYVDQAAADTTNKVTLSDLCESSGDSFGDPIRQIFDSASHPSGCSSFTVSQIDDFMVGASIAGAFGNLRTNGKICVSRSSAFAPSILTALAAVGLILL
jgi:hypothetical protein